MLPCKKSAALYFRPDKQGRPQTRIGAGVKSGSASRRSTGRAAAGRPADRVSVCGRRDSDPVCAGAGHFLVDMPGNLYRDLERPLAILAGHLRSQPTGDG